MLIAKLNVGGTSAEVTAIHPVPKGIVGATIEAAFGEEWDGLTKAAVFKGVVTKDVLDIGDVIKIPAECVTKSGYRLRVGFYGTSGEELIIPTLWADIGIVQDAADPSGDTSTDPDLPVWVQLQEQVDEIRQNGGGGGAGMPGPQGPKGDPGEPGKDGKDYILTEADKREIAGMVEVSGGGSSGESNVYVLADGETAADAPEWAEVIIDPNGNPNFDLPTDAHINALINEALSHIGIAEEATF